MDIPYYISLLYSKNHALAYGSLKKLEALSSHCDALYPYLDQFATMAISSHYSIKVRGFRLFCKQALWDKENSMSRYFPGVLAILHDDRPTALRQGLAALEEVIIHQTTLVPLIEKEIQKINYVDYKETMHKVLSMDIDRILLKIKERSDIHI